MKNWRKAALFYLEYIIFRLLLIVLENLPIRMSYGIARIIGIVACYLTPSKRRQIEANLKIGYPEGISFPLKSFTRDVFIHLMYMIFEFALSRRLFHKHNWHHYVQGPGINMLKEVLSLYPVCIFCSAHLGNFPLLGHVVYFIGRPLVTVIRSLKNPLLTKEIIKLLQRSGHRVVVRENAYQYFQKAIAEGISPTMTPDQHAGRLSGKRKPLYVEFMGKKAYTAAGPAALARRFHLPIFVGILFRTGIFRFEFHVKEVPIPTPVEDKERDLENITRNLNQVLEDFIKMHPEQWFWMHRRWREPHGSGSHSDGEEIVL